MKKLKSQLKVIANSLATLSQKVEKVVEQLDKLQVPKKPAAKKMKVPLKKPAVKKAAQKKQVTVLESVFNAIKRTKKGVTVAKLKEKTNLNPKQLSNALYKLTKQDKIEAKSRGLYVIK